MDRSVRRRFSRSDETTPHGHRAGSAAYPLFPSLIVDGAIPNDSESTPADGGGRRLDMPGSQRGSDATLGADEPRCAVGPRAQVRKNEVSPTTEADGRPSASFPSLPLYPKSPVFRSMQGFPLLNPLLRLTSLLILAVFGHWPQTPISLNENGFPKAVALWRVV